MKDIQDLVGLPWQLAEPKLREAKVSYTVQYGESYNRFFKVAEDRWYIYRIRICEKVSSQQKQVEVFLLHPMINSGFADCNEVMYVEEFIK